MSFGRYQTAQLQTATGVAVSGAQVYFLTQPANPSNLTPQAQVYADAAGTQPISQPLITDGFGEFAAYLSPGVYTVVYISPFTGTLIYPDQNIAVGGGTPGSTTFDEIGSGTNITASMVVGSGASLAPSGSGSIGATSIGGVSVTGTPGTGQVLTATSPTAAHWAPGGGSGGVTSLNALTGALSIVAGSGINVVVSGSTVVISLGTVFAITGFSGGSTVELGTTIVNPVFTASYSTTPASASITNTEGIDSPLALSSPFTSGTVIGNFVHAAVQTTTFTLSATQGSTLTATQNINWEPRSFGGVGTAGATSFVTASGTTAVLSTGDILASIDLAASNVGTTYGPFTPSSQNVYLLLIGGSHTFVDTGTGFPFAFDAPIAVTFVNINGVTVNMFLYKSTNPLFGTYNIKVVT